MIESVSNSTLNVYAVGTVRDGSVVNDLEVLNISSVRSAVVCPSGPIC